MPTTSGSRTYAGVRIDWRCNDDRSACEVRVWWQQSLLFDTPLGPNRPSLPFSAESDDGRTRIAGELVLNYGRLVLSRLAYLGGRVSDVVLAPTDAAWPEPPSIEPGPQLRESGLGYEEDASRFAFPDPSVTTGAGDEARAGVRAAEPEPRYGAPLPAPTNPSAAGASADPGQAEQGPGVLGADARVEVPAPPLFSDAAPAPPEPGRLFSVPGQPEAGLGVLGADARVEAPAPPLFSDAAPAPLRDFMRGPAR